MQSLYKVIKNNSVVKDGSKEIVTKFNKDREAKQKEISETNAEMFIDSYENLAKAMVESARKEREEILLSANIEAERASKEAYEKAYQEGHNAGFNKAYEDGYKNNLDRALQEAEIIKNNADNILKTCLEEKERYVREKENEIKALIVNCVENILKKEVKDKESLNNIVFDSLSKIKNTKAFIIKSNQIYCEEFKSKVDLWKEQLPFKGDIFIIPDESIEEGSAIIEMDTGKIVIGAGIALEKIQEIMSSVE
jgi:flagellar assembly protein FliH